MARSARTGERTRAHRLASMMAPVQSWKLWQTVSMGKPRCMRLKTVLMGAIDTTILTATGMHANDLASRHALCMFLYRKG